MPRTTAGPGSNIESLLDEYGIGANSWASDVFASDTDRLLLANLLELRDQDLVDALDEAGDDYQDQKQTATYHSEELTASTDWSETELGFTASSIDLRITNANVEIAFANPVGNDQNQVPYGTGDSPVVGIPAETSKVWLRRDPAAGSDATVQLDAWA